MTAFALLTPAFDLAGAPDAAPVVAGATTAGSVSTDDSAAPGDMIWG